MRKKHLVWSIILWTMLITIFFAWNYSVLISNNQDVVENKAQAFFKQILITRAWNSQHGGVYVPITKSTQPNPYLKDPNRDIVTIDGIALTKINPSFMTRQIAEIHKTKYGVQFHITSLNPIRPANTADLWETKALRLFEEDTSELLEMVEDKSGSEYRYMAPLMVENSCLNCHAAQGYKLGDIRGGISVSFPATVYLNSIKKSAFSFAIIHLLILSFGIVGLVLFYRKQRKYYSIIKNKTKELTHINATKDKVFAIIAHDLRSPFNNILGYTDLLIGDYETLNEEQRRKFIAKISESSKGAFELVENLLLWASSQQNSISINKKNLNIKKLVNETLNALTSTAEKKKITININISEKLLVFADEFTMKIIITNLVSNAIKFTHENGRITIDAKQTVDLTEIHISDNGVGIPPETIPKLFMVDQNISSLGTNNEKGTGLGLVLCKEFIEKNGGSIAVESTLETGTKFMLKIPQSNS